MSEPDRRKAVLVTGAAGGLGGATARLLARRGWQVFAGDLRADEVSAIAGVTPLALDVTDPASVDAAVAAVRRDVDGLDAVVNFAGILAIGAMIEMDEERLRRVLEVNVLGTFRVNKAFFGLLQARRGRIVNISSETGHQAGGPFNGAYAMSKHAIEAYSDSLRRELSLVGIPVVKVQPGPFRTDMVSSIDRQFAAAAESSALFGPTLQRLTRRIAAEQAKAADPAVLAAVVHTALTVARPKPAYRVAQDRQRALLDLLPVRWGDAVLRRVLQSR